MVKKVQYLDPSAAVPDTQQPQPQGLGREEWENTTPDALKPVATQESGLVADLGPARQLYDAGFRLCALHPNSKRPVGMAWNDPANCVQDFDEKLTGYGLPLPINGRISIDPDQVDMARVAITAWGFDYDALMDAGVRTASTRPGSGGRSQFVDPGGLQHIKLKFRLDNGAKAYLELRAAAANVQDVIPGLIYDDGDGNICTQRYLNGRTFLDAMPLPADFLKFWRRCSTDHEFLMAQELIAHVAMVKAGLLPSGTKAAHDRSRHALQHPETNKRLRALFNDNTDVESILERHRYARQRGGRWSAPNSRGAPGINLIEGHQSLWQSFHGSDLLEGTFDAAAAAITLDFNDDIGAFEEKARTYKQSAYEAFGGVPGGEEVPDFAELTVVPGTSPANFFKVTATPFPLKNLPALFRSWAEEQSAASGFDVGAYAYILLAAASGWIDQRARVTLTRIWKEPMFVWAGLVEGSGGGKSPVLKAGFAHINKLNGAMMRESVAAVGNRRQQRGRDAAEQIARAEMEAEAPEIAAEIPEEPVIRQRILKDATTEAVAQLCVTNPEGMISIHDDISAFVGRMDAYGNAATGKDRAFYLGMHDGSTDHPVNRSGKDPLIVPNLSGSILAGIQPGVFRKLTKGGATDDGMFQRFLLYKMQPSGRVNLRARISQDILDQVDRVFEALFDFGPVTITLDNEATQLAEDYINVTRDEFHPSKMEESHAAKLIGATFRIAGTLHLLDAACEGRTPDDTLGVETLKRAIRIVWCLRDNAFSVYSEIEDNEAVALAQFALEEIVASGVDEITQGDLSRHNKAWSEKSGDSTAIQRAILLLEERGVTRKTGATRRGSVSLQVNPRLIPALGTKVTELISLRRERRESLKAAIAAKTERP